MTDKRDTPQALCADCGLAIVPGTHHIMYQVFCGCIVVPNTPPAETGRNIGQSASDSGTTPFPLGSYPETGMPAAKPAETKAGPPSGCSCGEGEACTSLNCKGHPRHVRCNNPLHFHADGTPHPHDIGPSCMSAAEPAAPVSPPGVYSRPECPFNYCDTKAPHTECLKGCHYAEPDRGMDRAVDDNRPDERIDNAAAPQGNLRTCSKCGTNWTVEVDKCPVCEVAPVSPEPPIIPFCKRHNREMCSACLRIEREAGTVGAKPEPVLGALAAAKVALHMLTDSPATSDSNRNMVFRMAPNDYLRIREIEEFIATTLDAAQSLPSPVVRGWMESLPSPAPQVSEDEVWTDDWSAEEVAATAYQILGALQAPARVLDYFSAVAQGERPATILPFCPSSPAQPVGTPMEREPFLEYAKTYLREWSENYRNHGDLAKIGWDGGQMEYHLSNFATRLASRSIIVKKSWHGTATGMGRGSAAQPVGSADKEQSNG